MIDTVFTKPLAVLCGAKTAFAISSALSATLQGFGRNDGASVFIIISTIVSNENIRVIQKENQRMTKMLSQLLMLSRGYEGRYHFKPKELCLYDMVESVSESLVAMAETKSIQIHNEVSETFLIYADQSLFTQLLVNLIENSIKYGNIGGNIWIAFKKEKEYKLCIKDDGNGL